MGTGFDVNISEEAVGVIPRAVAHLFNGIEKRKQAAQEKGEPLPDFKILVQFMEVGIYMYRLHYTVMQNDFMFTRYVLCTRYDTTEICF